MKKVSIIIPVYNASRFLTRCLDSLVNQTLKEIEIICINDGSTDDSSIIIKKYVKKYPSKVYLYNIKNSGPGYARNYGIKKSIGEYIGFVDSDDYVDHEMYEKMYKKAVSSNAEIVICDYYFENDCTKKLKINGDKKMYPATLKKKPAMLNIIDPCPWNKIFKRNLIINCKYRFPEKLKYEDFGYIPILLIEANKIEKVNEPLYFYYQNNIGETATVNDRIFDILDIFLILVNYIKEKNLLKEFYEELEYLFVKKFLIYNEKSLLLNEKHKTKEFLKKSFSFMDKYFPKWRKNKYFKETKNIFRTFIKQNKCLYILYRLYIRRK